ncbi:unnamed protein product [Soboliphyme baturini]|uniref:Carboxylic ester hydrolase n=1 Tax=Soboliphyme baturini TaxID=241478 RepID=A0A183IRT2_9BILA|nr:unnamed protein product [Soboliphyme baturini]
MPRYQSIVLLCTSLFSWIVLSLTQKHTMVVHTSHGPISGTQEIALGKHIVSFLNVQYGKAPVGQLRFSPPQEPDSWKETRNCTELALACYQLKDKTIPGFEGTEMWNANTRLAEDCLNLNLWAPVDAVNVPVLVWIFGGGYYYGSPSLELYRGDYIAAYGNVIVVNINYRLGPNIRLFGGDPSKVTIFGESAGAASVSLHLAAPGSWKYFRYAIMQSGAFTSSWASRPKEKLKETSMTLAEMLNCRRGTVSETLRCMREVDADKVQQTSEKLVADFLSSSFTPVSEDKNFLQQNLDDIVKQGRFKRTSVIIGTNADEGSFWLPTYFPNWFNSTSDGKVSYVEFMRSLRVAFKWLPEDVRRMIASHFIHNKLELLSADASSLARFPFIYRDALSSIIGDHYFVCNIFTERSTANPWPKWMGVMHGYEIEYVFGMPLRHPELYTKEENEFSKSIMDYWVSFARNG